KSETPCWALTLPAVAGWSCLAMRYAPTLESATTEPSMAKPLATGTRVVPDHHFASQGTLDALGRRPTPAWIGTWGLNAGQGALVLGLLIFLALPLLGILAKSVMDSEGNWTGLSVLAGIIGADGFLAMVARSLAVGVVTMAVVVPCAYAFAYALTR